MVALHRISITTLTLLLGVPSHAYNGNTYEDKSKKIYTLEGMVSSCGVDRSEINKSERHRNFYENYKNNIDAQDYEIRRLILGQLELYFNLGLLGGQIQQIKNPNFCPNILKGYNDSKNSSEQ